MSNNDSLVITGVGILSPIGNRKEDYWEGIRNGASGIGEITIFDALEYGCGIAEAIDSRHIAVLHNTVLPVYVSHNQLIGDHILLVSQLPELVSILLPRTNEVCKVIEVRPMCTLLIVVVLLLACTSQQSEQAIACARCTAGLKSCLTTEVCSDACHTLCTDHTGGRVLHLFKSQTTNER